MVDVPPRRFPASITAASATSSSPHLRRLSRRQRRGDAEHRRPPMRSDSHRCLPAGAVARRQLFPHPLGRPARADRDRLRQLPAAYGRQAAGQPRAAGVDPADIETVMLTHMHPDHSAGLTDMKTGRRHFPNAELVVHENEPRHWFDDGDDGQGDGARKEALFPVRARAGGALPGADAPVAAGGGVPRRHSDTAPRPHAWP